LQYYHHQSFKSAHEHFEAEINFPSYLRIMIKAFNTCSLFVTIMHFQTIFDLNLSLIKKEKNIYLYLIRQRVCFPVNEMFTNVQYLLNSLKNIDLNVG